VNGPAADAVVTTRNVRLASIANEYPGQADEPHDGLDLPLLPRRPRSGARRRASANGAGRVGGRAGGGARAVPGMRAGQDVDSIYDHGRPGQVLRFRRSA